MCVRMCASARRLSSSARRVCASAHRVICMLHACASARRVCACVRVFFPRVRSARARVHFFCVPALQMCILAHQAMPVFACTSCSRGTGVCVPPRPGHDGARHAAALPAQGSGGPARHQHLESAAGLGRPAGRGEVWVRVRVCVRAEGISGMSMCVCVRA